MQDDQSVFAHYQPHGMKYRRFLQHQHETHLFDWYMEIGCRSGGSFAPVRSKTIAVDPFFQVERNVIQEKPALLVFQQTSDAFFQSKILKRMGCELSLSFLDGMHLFEYLLRDFMNTESVSARNGVILMHDCCPFSHQMTTRDLDNLPTGAWTGDVWKLIPILKQFRPDLRIEVLNCRPTGIVAVSNLDPQNRVLQESYGNIVSDWTDVTLRDFGAERYFTLFDYTKPRNYLADPNNSMTRAAMPEAAHQIPEFVTP